MGQRRALDLLPITDDPMPEAIPVNTRCMTEFAVNHNTRDATENRPPTANKSSAGEPRQAEREPDAGGMQCELLRWAAEQTNITPHLQGILIRMVRMMAPDGTLMLPQAVIAHAVGLGETQTRAAIKALVTGGVLLRKRRGSVGKGRQSDVLQANLDHKPDIIGIPASSLDNREIVDVSSVSPNFSDNRDNADTVGKAKLSHDNGGKPPVSKSPRAYKEITGARAETLNLNTNTLELYPEASECVSDASEREMRGGGTFQEDWVLSAKDRAFANSQGILNGSVDVVFGMFGAHHLSKHTISANWGGEWRKWVLRQAHDPRFQSSTPKDRTNDLRASSTADIADIRVRGEPVSPATAARMRRQAERRAQREPIDLGRVDSIRIP